MGQQIIRQPNGRYAVWSTIIDDVIAYDGTRQEIVNFFVAEELKKVERDMNGIIDKLEKGEKPYHQFTMTWKEAMKDRKKAHPKAPPLKLMA